MPTFFINNLAEPKTDGLAISLFVFFHRLKVVLKLDNGDYPENSLEFFRIFYVFGSCFKTLAINLDSFFLFIFFLKKKRK